MTKKNTTEMEARRVTTKMHRNMEVPDLLPHWLSLRYLLIFRMSSNYLSWNTYR